jgi:hypothetical protein
MELLKGTAKWLGKDFRLRSGLCGNGLSANCSLHGGDLRSPVLFQSQNPEKGAGQKLAITMELPN